MAVMVLPWTLNLTVVFQVEGSTLGATSDKIPSCYSDQPDLFAGVWYTVIGTGSDAALSLCEIGGNYNGFAITIFEGDSCGTLVCMVTIESYEVCQDGLNLYPFSWTTSAGASYYIFVSLVGGVLGPLNFQLVSLLATTVLFFHLI